MSLSWETYRKIKEYRKWLYKNRFYIIQHAQPDVRSGMAARLDDEIYKATSMLCQLESRLLIRFDVDLDEWLTHQINKP